MNVVRIAPARVPAFVDLAYAIGARDPSFVPPLRQVVEAELTGRSTFARYGSMELYGVERDGKLVARAAAIVNPRLTDESGAPLGQVGYFESEDDVEAARALFAACLSSLASRGARQVVGPMNGGAHRSHRLMTQGFERDPFLFEPRNPSWYPKLFEASGFAPIHSWSTFDLMEPDVRRLHRVLARASSGLPHAGVFEQIDPRRPGVLPRLHALLDRVWRGHIGYAPLDADEVAEVIGGVLVLMTDRDFGITHDQEGHDLGVSFMYPNYVNEVRAIDGDATRWGAWLGGPRPRTRVMHTHAVVEEARRTNAVSLGLLRGMELFHEDAYERLVVALVTGEWKFFERHAPPTRKYALYGRSVK